eukprot:CAMPEP_0198205478 /NCGR_PEP_ID=MMETSP1445-20131203/9030_1 /TAXON_ID=36898 /ORGANISM="Pyramimonas sp., Strain CCMP2087" /LENGTH=410 /DNA_ID=CAMNT_0043877813 /DNA_START=62 /DNA_END=1295 /DNA_ORIENTATION=-
MNDEGEEVGLTVSVGGAFMVQLPRTKTTYVRVRSFSYESHGIIVNIMWLYTKSDALEIIPDGITRAKIRSANPNTLYESNHFADISAETFIESIGLLHIGIAPGIYGQILSPLQQKESRNFVFDSTIDIYASNPKLTATPLVPFNSVEAGSVYPQPSFESGEQLRTRLGESFFRMKASTGSHRNNILVDADMPAFLDLVAAVPHVRTAATIRIVSPSPESMKVLCNPDYLVKVVSHFDVIRCKVVLDSVRIVFYLKTCRLGISYAYTRERKQGQRWVLMDNAAIATMRKGVIRVGVGDVIVTADLVGGGLPVDSCTTLKHVRILLDLHDLADNTVTDGHSFWLKVGDARPAKVTRGREEKILVLDTPDTTYYLKPMRAAVEQEENGGTARNGVPKGLLCVETDVDCLFDH